MQLVSKISTNVTDRRTDRRTDDMQSQYRAIALVHRAVKTRCRIRLNDAQVKAKYSPENIAHAQVKAGAIFSGLYLLPRDAAQSAVMPQYVI